MDSQAAVQIVRTVMSSESRVFDGSIWRGGRHEIGEGQKGCGDMARTVGIGKQDFENIREKRSFIWIRQNSSVNGGRARMM